MTKRALVLILPTLAGLLVGWPVRAGSAGPVQLAQAAAQLQPFSRGTVTIKTAGGQQAFTVEVATSDEQKEQGLMFRRTLRPDAGMWFDYSHQVEPVAFWMKNTYIPLDIVFVGADGRILSIHERAVPLSLESLGSGGPVSAVLELNGGTAARLGLKPGDPVTFTVS